MCLFHSGCGRRTGHVALWVVGLVACFPNWLYSGCILSGVIWFAAVDVGCASRVFAEAPAGETASESPAETPTDPIMVVRKLLADGKRKEALQALEKAIAEATKFAADHPKDPRALFQLARCQYERRRDPTAKKTLAQAIELAPADPDLIAFRGLIHFHDKELDQAEAELKRAVKLSKDKPKYRYELARFFASAKRADEAKTTLEAIVRDDPKWSEPRMDLAAMLFEANERPKAIQLVRDGLVLNDNDHELRDALGQMLQIADQTRDAYDVYGEIIDRNPTDFRAAAKLVQLAAQLNLPDEVENHLERIRNLYAAGNAPTEFFCREQFVLGDKRVFAFEYFRPRGDRQVLYRFDVTGKDDEAVTSRVALGSFESTTQTAREAKTIGPDDRMYHVDEYIGREHRNFALIPRKPPAYSALRTMVVEIVEGKRRPLSTTVQPAAPAPPK